VWINSYPWDTIEVKPLGYFASQRERLKFLEEERQRLRQEALRAQLKPKRKMRPETLLKRRLTRLQHQRVAAHPDRGGSHEKFIEINAEYQRVKQELEAFKVQ
jgi:hypothetical protein